MSLTTALSATISSADGLAGSTPGSKTISISFAGSSFSYKTLFSVATSPTSVPIDVIAAQFIYLKNTSSTAILTVTLTPLILLGSPSTPSLSSVSSGSLSGATYYVKITYVNQFGETVGSSEQSQSCISSHVVRVASPTASGSAPGTATGYNVYVGASSGTEVLQNGSTPIDIGTYWQLPDSGLVADTAAPPTVNTASGTPGSAEVVGTLEPGAIMIMAEPAAGSGWSSISLAGNEAGTCEYVLAG